MKSFKKDILVSFLIGAVAGFLLFLIFQNLKINIGGSLGPIIYLAPAILAPVGYAFAYFMSRWIPIFLQFTKFGITGSLNTLVDLGILNFLIYLTGAATGLYYTLFKAISFSVAVTNSYFLNKYWTFRAIDRPPEAGEFLKFLTVNLIGFLLNVGVASLIVNVIGAPISVQKELWANIGAVVASLTGLFWNFFGTKFIVFKR